MASVYKKNCRVGSISIYVLQPFLGAVPGETLFLQMSETQKEVQFPISC